MRHIIILCLCLAAVIFSYLINVQDDKVYILGFESPHRCPLYYHSGIKCVLCGMTRSFVSAAHLKFTSAANYHLLGAAVFAFICLQIPYRIYALSIHPKKMNPKLTRTNIIVTVTLVVSIGINWLIYLGGKLL